MDADKQRVKEIAELLNSADRLEVTQKSKNAEKQEDLDVFENILKKDIFTEKEENAIGKRESEDKKEDFLSKLDSLDEKHEAEDDRLGSALKRIEKIENSLHQIKAKINDDKQYQEGISSAQIEKIIAEKINEAIKSIRNDLAAKEEEKFPDYSQYKEELKNERENTVQNSDEFVILDEEEKDEPNYMVDQEDEYEYEDGLINKKEKKQNSILKTFLSVMLLTFLFVLVIIAGYYIAKKSESSDAAEKISYQPKHENKNTVKPLSEMINENAIAKSKPEAIKVSGPKVASPIDTSKISHPSTGDTKLVELETQRVSDYGMNEAKTEKSPIEKELLGSVEKKDIAFACRLKAKYHAGDYIYYLKNGSLYTPNPASNTVEILEQNVIYNYSPDSEFVKVGEGKYLKSKIFTQCSSIQAR